MRIEILPSWSLKDGFGSSSKYWHSAWLTGLLCVLIMLSLLGVIYIKYENHRLYSQLKKIENQAHVLNRDYQVMSSQHMTNVSYEAIQNFIGNRAMSISNIA